MSQGNLRSGIIEVLAIVGSILLAFAIDAAWDSRQESRVEQVILENLLAEFRLNRAELVRHQARWIEARSASERLLRLAATGEGMAPAVVDTLLYGFMTPTTYDASSGSLGAVMQSGGLQLIQNRDLRSYLAGWSGVVDDLRDNELAMREFILSTITPFLAERGVPLSRAQALIADAGLRGTGGSGGSWPAPLPSDEVAAASYRDLLRDPEFEVLLGTRYVWINVQEYQDAIDYVDQLLALVDAEID